jgi:hypothetical protein
MQGVNSTTKNIWSSRVDSSSRDFWIKEVNSTRNAYNSRDASNSTEMPETEAATTGCLQQWGR